MTPFLKQTCTILIAGSILYLNAASAEAKIARHRAPLIAFQHVHPCPSTNRTTGPCPGYQKDHRVPLCFSGADEIWNLQWLSIKEHRAKTVLDDRACAAKRRALARSI